MGLIGQGKELGEFINSKKKYLNRNAELFDIYEGNLKPYVQTILRQTLSENYYEKIKSRIYPVNILQRLIDKLSRVYSDTPERTASEKQEILEMYEGMFQINKRMAMADEFTNLFKGYALEPYVYNGKPKLNVIPYDRFLVKCEDIMNPMRVTHFLKHVGNKKNEKEESIEVWFVYTKEEFMAIDQNGRILREYMQENEGVNPFGFIPFMYSTTSEHSLMPVQDTDTLELAKLLPVQLTDLAGAIMFQCFSIVYGVDVDSENMTMSPNAFWNFKSDPQSDKTPSIGTIKPQADIDKVMSFIKDTLTTWLETKGIRVGSVGHLQASNMSSGVSKIIDEMDAFEKIKRQMDMFKYDEYRFWKLIGKMHNRWIEFGEIQGQPPLPEDWEVITEFKEPEPKFDRQALTKNVIDKLTNEVISQETAIRELYPAWTDERVIEELEKIASDSFEPNSSGNDFNG